MHESSIVLGTSTPRNPLHFPLAALWAEGIQGFVVTRNSLRFFFFFLLVLVIIEQESVRKAALVLSNFAMTINPTQQSARGFKKRSSVFSVFQEVLSNFFALSYFFLASFSFVAFIF